jgi:hypothetical protein
MTATMPAYYQQVEEAHTATMGLPARECVCRPMIQRALKARETGSYGGAYLIIVGDAGYEDGAEAATMTGASTVLAPPERTRGVFVPGHDRETLFADTHELRTADLPRWRPQITLDRRTLARNED